MIDWDRVEELRTDFGEDDFVEIVTMFLGEVELKLDEMRGGMPEAELSEGFHFVKGSAANLGFQAVQKLAAEGEVSPSGDRVSELSEVFSASKTSFQAEIGADPRLA